MWTQSISKFIKLLINDPAHDSKYVIYNETEVWVSWPQVSSIEAHRISGDSEPVVGSLVKMSNGDKFYSRLTPDKLLDAVTV